MYFKHSFAPLNIRTIDRNLSVKPTRTQQCRVQNIGTICCCNNNNPFIHTEPIHFNKQLVQCLFTLIMTTAKASTTLPTYSVNFIDKNNTRCIFLRVFKQIANTGGTDPYEHFYEVRSTDGKEWNARFSSHCSSK